MAGAQKPRVGKHQRRWDVALFHQNLGAVNVGQNQLQQPGPLEQAGFQGGPFRRRDEQWHHIQGPGGGAAGGIVEGVESRAVFVTPAPDAFLTVGKHPGAHVFQRRDERLPVGSWYAGRREGLAIGFRRTCQGFKQLRRRGWGRCRRAGRFGCDHTSDASVIGCRRRFTPISGANQGYMENLGCPPVPAAPDVRRGCVRRGGSGHGAALRPRWR